MYSLIFLCGVIFQNFFGTVASEKEYEDSWWGMHLHSLKLSSRGLGWMKLAQQQEEDRQKRPSCPQGLEAANPGQQNKPGKLPISSSPSRPFSFPWLEAKHAFFALRPLLIPDLYVRMRRLCIVNLPKINDECNDRGCQIQVKGFLPIFLFYFALFYCVYLYFKPMLFIYASTALLR